MSLLSSSVDVVFVVVVVVADVVVVDVFVVVVFLLSNTISTAVKIVHLSGQHLLSEFSRRPDIQR